MTLVFDGSPNATGTITGQIYGLLEPADILDLILLINNKPANVTSFDGINFTIDFTLPWGSGINNIVLTAETDCGTSILEGTITT